MNLYNKILISDKNKTFNYPILIGEDVVNSLETYFSKILKNKKVLLF